MMFFSAAPISTPTGSSLAYKRNVGPEKSRWMDAANSRSSDAITRAVGSPPRHFPRKRRARQNSDARREFFADHLARHFRHPQQRALFQPFCRADESHLGVQMRQHRAIDRPRKARRHHPHDNARICQRAAQIRCRLNIIRQRKSGRKISFTRVERMRSTRSASCAQSQTRSNLGASTIASAVPQLPAPIIAMTAASFTADYRIGNTLSVPDRIRSMFALCRCDDEYGRNQRRHHHHRRRMLNQPHRQRKAARCHNRPH